MYARRRASILQIMTEGHVRAPFFMGDKGEFGWLALKFGGGVCE
jgi:hypothetical protein